MIEIKSFFGDWQEVSQEKAMDYIRHMMQGITTTSDPSKKAEFIDGKHLRGITVEELFETNGKFVMSGGGDSYFVGIDFVSRSLGCTVWARGNTDLGLRDRDEMMERIGRMTNYEKSNLVLRGERA